MKIDYLIVGSGFAGCVLAERIASQLNKRVLMVEKRNHIGGNAYDYYNDDGILVHKYGPHYFRTNEKEVWDYLSRFTQWHYVQYTILASVEGQLLPLPINLDTYNELFGTRLSSMELETIFKNNNKGIKEIKNSRDAIVSRAGLELYEKFFKNYTKKQWDLWPEELDPSVCSRIPIRSNCDDRYFTDRYQAMPKYGYHKLFANMINHPNVHLMLQTDYKDIKDVIQCDKVIYSGPIDEFFDYKYGKLPYRSLRFEHETRDTEYYQPVSQVNYPNDYDFTRIVEIKHATGQKHQKTTIVREYPASEGDPYYPVPNFANEAIYQKYKSEADKLEDIIFLGRLAEYKYFNMDQIVKNALALFDKISAEKRQR